MKSRSSSWDLSHKQRMKIREEGYCLKLCGIGYDSYADGYDILMEHYQETDKNGEFDDLDSAMENGETGSELSEMFAEANKDFDKKSILESLNELAEIYCDYNDFFLDECMELYHGVATDRQSTKCFEYCLKEIREEEEEEEEEEDDDDDDDEEEEDDEDYAVSFEDMPPIKQKYEKCLDDFDGPNEYVDFENKTAVEDIDAILSIFRKNGFVVLKNFFSPVLIDRIRIILNEWDEKQMWNNLTYSDFYSIERDLLRSHDHRLEIALPYTDPFETVISQIHNSILFKVMSAYGYSPKFTIDFFTSILSRPGAKIQELHRDHGTESAMMKLNIAVQDTPQTIGPTSFCPCSHLNGHIHATYENKCGIRYHPKFIKAGSIIIYDQTLIHSGMANTGNTKRFILDLSYNVGNFLNNYQNNYPRVAQDHIKKYRRDLGKLF